MGTCKFPMVHTSTNLLLEKEFAEPFTFGNGQQLEPAYFEFLHYLPAYREEDLISRWDFEESIVERIGKIKSLT